MDINGVVRETSKKKKKNALCDWQPLWKCMRRRSSRKTPSKNAIIVRAVEL